MAQGILKGSRLAYVVQKIEGTVKRPKASWTKKEGIKFRMMDEPAGWMVYFPRGHCIRIKDMKHLKHYKLDGQPQIIELQGLNDPNSPLGKMFLSQDEKLRQASYQELEKMVIDLCNSRGRISVPTEGDPSAQSEVDA